MGGGWWVVGGGWWVVGGGWWVVGGGWRLVDVATNRSGFEERVLATGVALGSHERYLLALRQSTDDRRGEKTSRARALRRSVAFCLAAMRTRNDSTRVRSTGRLPRSLEGR